MLGGNLASPETPAIPKNNNFNHISVRNADNLLKTFLVEQEVSSLIISNIYSDFKKQNNLTEIALRH